MEKINRPIPSGGMPTGKPSLPPAKEKEYSFTMTETEVVAEIQSLEADEDLNLFIRVQRGAMKFDRYQELLKAIEQQKQI